LCAQDWAKSFDKTSVILNLKQTKKCKIYLFVFSHLYKNVTGAYLAVQRFVLFFLNKYSKLTKIDLTKNKTENKRGKKLKQYVSK